MASVKGILLFIPMYNCAKQIPAVLAQLNEPGCEIFSEILIVDNGSTDGGVDACAAAIENNGVSAIRTLVQNDDNYNLGGSHKVAFNYAIDKGYDYVAVLHGDNQGNIADLLAALRVGDYANYDCLLGARFMPGAQLVNYPIMRTLGNHVFDVLYSIVCGRRLFDLGSGLNLYKTEFLRSRAFLKFPNRLTFNYYMLLYTVAAGARFRFFPISWREDDQVSNLNMFRHAWEMVKILLFFTFRRRRFVDTWHVPEQDYTCRTIKQLASGSRA